MLEYIYYLFGGKKGKPGQRFHMLSEEFENIFHYGNLHNDLFNTRDAPLCLWLAMMTQVNEIDKERHL